MRCTRLPKAAGLSNFASDIADYGHGTRQEFLSPSAPAEAFDVVANPPSRLAPLVVKCALTLGAVKTIIIFPTARLNAVRVDAGHRCHPQTFIGWATAAHSVVRWLRRDAATTFEQVLDELAGKK